MDILKRLGRGFVRLVLHVGTIAFLITVAAALCLEVGKLIVWAQGRPDAPLSEIMGWGVPTTIVCSLVVGFSWELGGDR